MALKWITSVNNPAINYGVDITIEEPTFIIDWSSDPNCSPYIMGIGMLDVYLNGVLLQKNAWRELSPTSIEYLDINRPLIEGDVISIRFKNGAVNLGNIRVVSSYAQLLEVPNPIFNEVAIVTNTKKFYKYGDYGWEEFVIPFTTQNIGILFQHESQSITDTSQRQYTLEEIAYSPNMGNLLVFIDGELVDPSKYTEVDNRTIVFNEDLPASAETIEFISVNTDTWEESFNHTVEYDYDSQGSVSKEITKFNGSVVKQTNYAYDTEGNVTQEIITKGMKTIIRDYEYDEAGNVSKITVTIVG